MDGHNKAHAHAWASVAEIGAEAVLAGDAGRVVACFLRTDDLLALSHVSRRLRHAMNAFVFAQTDRLWLCLSPHASAHHHHHHPAMCWQPDTIHTHLAWAGQGTPCRLLHGLSFPHVHTLHLHTTPPQLTAWAPTLTSALPSLHCLSLHLSPPSPSSPPVAAHPRVVFPPHCYPHLLHALAPSLSRLCLSGAADCVLAPTFLSHIPSLPHLHSLEVSQLVDLPGPGTLVAVFSRLRFLTVLRVHRTEKDVSAVTDHHCHHHHHGGGGGHADEGCEGQGEGEDGSIAQLCSEPHPNCDEDEGDEEVEDGAMVGTVPFGINLVHALCDSELELVELSVSNEWIPLGELLRDHGTLVTLRWSVDTAAPHLNIVEGAGYAEWEPGEGTSQLADLRVVGVKHAQLTPRGAERLVRVCPNLEVLRLEDLPLQVPSHDLASANSPPNVSVLAFNNTTAGVLNALATLPVLGELELVFAWPSDEHSTTQLASVVELLGHCLSWVVRWTKVWRLFVGLRLPRDPTPTQEHAVRLVCAGLELFVGGRDVLFDCAALHC